MAGVTRTLTFAEGVSTSGPTTTFLQTTQFATYADEATFVSNKGSAAADGDAFYDTTLDVVKIYANGAWQIIYDDSDTNVALLTGSQTFSGAKTFSSAVTVSDSTSSTTKDTGSIVTEGGVGIEENLNVGGNVNVTGDLTVSGTTTSVDDLTVTDETITVNNGGNQASADTNDAGIIVDMSDATNATLHYDSTATSKWKAGEVGSTVEIADISSSQVLTNKDIDGGTASNTSRITLPKASTSTLDALTRKEGTIVFDTDINKVKYDDGTNLNELGGGAGGINHVEGGDAEGGTTGWATYSDAAASKPVDGTGGSPTTTWGVTASAPIRGTQSFILTKDAANRQGEGVAYPFDVPNGDLHSVQEIYFEATTSANYVDNDVVVYIYNTDSNELIEPVPIELKAGEAGEFRALFQTHATDNSYRLIFHIASTNSNAWTVKIDSVRVGPPEKVIATPMNDWESFTATGNFSTNATYTAFERRVGDTGEFDIHITFSGATDAVTADIDPPRAIDTAKISDSSNDGIIVGTFTMEDAGTDFYTVGHVYYHNTDNKFRLRVDDGDKTSSDVTNTNPFTIASGDNIWIKMSYPVSGWGSTVQMSSEINRSQIYARGAGNGGTSITAATTNIDFTETDDTAAFFDGTTITLPTSDLYHIEGTILFTTTAERTPSLYVDGSFHKAIGPKTGSVDTVGFSTLYKGTKGEALTIRVEANGGTLSNNTGFHVITVNRVNNPQTIAASELVAARYQTDSGQSIANAAYTIIDYDTKSYDTHGAVTTGVGTWKFTAPISGKYHLSAQVVWDTIALDAGEFVWSSVFKNGVVSIYRPCYESQATSSLAVAAHIDIDIDLNKDDYIDFRVYQNSGASAAIQTNIAYNCIMIHRLGF